MSLNLPAPGFAYDMHNEAQARAILEREDLRNLKIPQRGTWTPSLGGTATYNPGNLGTFTRTANEIGFTCNLDVNAIGTGSLTTIFGLPKPSSNSGVKSLSVGYFGGLVTAVTSLMAYINASTASIGFSCLTAAAVSATISPNLFQNGTVLFVSGRYETDAP